MFADVIWHGSLKHRSGSGVSNFVELSSTNPAALSYNGQDFYLRGTNFNNIDAIGLWQTPDITRIKVDETYYQKLSDMGGNHVRFGLSEPWYEQSSAQFFDVIDQHVEWARANNLWILLNNFVLPDNIYEAYGGSPFAGGGRFWTDEGLKARFKDYWIGVASHYANEPVICGYDLLNEPGAPDNATWFNYAQEIRDAIYAEDQNHLVIIESLGGGQFYHLFNGDNIIYSPHMYSPMQLTHATSSSSRSYPGYFKEWDDNEHYFSKQTMNGETELADSLTNLKSRYCINWAADHNVPVLIGEWGAVDYVPGWLQYIQDVGELFAAWNVHYSHFQFVSYDSHHWNILHEDTLIPFYVEFESIMENLFSGSLRPNF